MSQFDQDFTNGKLVVCCPVVMKIDIILNCCHWLPLVGVELKSTTGNLVVCCPVVFLDSNRAAPKSNNPFRKGIVGIQTAGTQNTNRSGLKG